MNPIIITDVMHAKMKQKVAEDMNTTRLALKKAELGRKERNTLRKKLILCKAIQDDLKNTVDYDEEFRSLRIHMNGFSFFLQIVKLHAKTGQETDLYTKFGYWISEAIKEKLDREER